MATNRWKVLVLCVAALSLTAMTCNKENPAPGQKPEADATANGSAHHHDMQAMAGANDGSADTDEAAGGSGGDATDVSKTLSGVPGMDFSSLSPAAQKELATVFNDEFCYCGCPHTLGACLKTHTSCKHAKRMALLAAADAANGVAAEETIVSLSKYYASFGQKRHEFNPDPRQCTGNKDAKVTVVEFSDFECPFCGAARPVLENFVKQNNKIRFCWMAFPLSAHPNAMPAATAAMYARDHGKFWEMHDALFENQTTLSPEFIKQLGGKLGLDANDLGKAISGNTYADAINASKEAGHKAGVDATPSLYINGRKHNLPFDEATLNHAVDDEIEWMTHKGWAPDNG